MGAGLTFVLTILIICGSILLGIYMCLCSDNEVKMFENPRYDERIRALEEAMKILKEK